MVSLSWPWFCFSDVFVDKRYVAPKLSLVNVTSLNKVLRSEVFVSKDRQLWVVHLILDFEPLSDNFQDVGHAMRAGDPWLARIDVSVLGFLTQEDLPPVELPFHCSPSWGSSSKGRDSLLAPITWNWDRPILSWGRRRWPRRVYGSDIRLGRELDRSSVARFPDDSFEEEEEMALN